MVDPHFIRKQNASSIHTHTHSNNMIYIILPNSYAHYIVECNVFFLHAFNHILIPYCRCLFLFFVRVQISINISVSEREYFHYSTAQKSFRYRPRFIFLYIYINICSYRARNDLNKLQINRARSYLKAYAVQ